MSNLSINSIAGAMTPGIDSQSNKITNMLKHADVTNMAQMMQLQMEESKYELAVKISSSLISDLKNAVSSIAQKS